MARFLIQIAADGRGAIDEMNRVQGAQERSARRMAEAAQRSAQRQQDVSARATREAIQSLQRVTEVTQREEQARTLAVQQATQARIAAQNAANDHAIQGTAQSEARARDAEHDAIEAQARADAASTHAQNEIRDVTAASERAQREAHEAALAARRAADQSAAAQANAARRASNSWTQMAKAGKLAFQATAVGLAVGGAAAVKLAGDFEQSTRTLVTGAGESADSLELVRKGVLGMAGEVGMTPMVLAEGMFAVESAGYRGAVGVEVLRAAAKGATANGAELSQTTEALTTIMVNYGMKAKGAQDGTIMATSAMNQLTAAAAASKVDVQDMAASLSSVLPVGAAAKLSFAEVAGAVATMTNSGMSAQQATQNLAFSIRSLSSPNMQAQKQFEQLGLDTLDIQKNLGKRGLTGTIDILVNAIGKSSKGGLVMIDTFNKSKQAGANASTMMKNLGPEAKKLAEGYMSLKVKSGDWGKELGKMDGVQSTQAKQWKTLYDKSKGFSSALASGTPTAKTFAGAMTKMMGGAAGLNTALMLTGTNSDAFKASVKGIETAAKTGSKGVTGWDVAQKDFNIRMAQAKAGVIAWATGIGMKLLPPLSSAVSWTMKNMWAVKLLAGVIGGVMIAAMIAYIVTSASAFAATISAAGGFAAYASSVWAAVTATLAAAAPILLIIAGLAALGYAVVYAYKHWDVFRNVVDTAMRAVVSVANWAWGALKAGISMFVSFWKNVLAPVFMWLFREVITPMFKVIRMVFDVWLTFMKIWVGLFSMLWKHTLGAIFNWLHDHVVAPLFKKLRGPINGFTNWLKEHVGPMWKGIVDGLGWIWNGLVSLVKVPIRFIVETVMNGGIIDGYNWLARKFGGKTVGHISLPWGSGNDTSNAGQTSRKGGSAFAAGGHVRGPGSGTSDSIPARLSAGEYVIRASRVRQLGVDTLDELNGSAGAGGSFGYAEGGLVKWGENALSGLWGAVSNPLGYVKGKMMGLMGGVGKSDLATILRGMAGQAVNLLSNVFGKKAPVVKSFTSGAGRAPSAVGGNAALGRTLAAGAGWTGGQWDALYQLWQHESGWNNNAQNPTSTAYGIAQFLNSTWGSVGATKTSDPGGQIRAGLRYIRGAYGTPGNAWSKWQSRSPHWYGDGGIVTGPTMAGLGESGPEMVIPLTNRRRIDELVGGSSGAGGGNGAAVIHTHIHLDGKEIHTSVSRRELQYQRRSGFGSMSPRGVVAF